MTGADKIKYLEAWVERLSAERDNYKGAWHFQTKENQRLESELAAAKAEIVHAAVEQPIKDNP